MRRSRAASTGVAFVDEPGRSLGAAEVSDVLERPVLAWVPVRPAIARGVDAGVIAIRPPDALVRAATRLLDRVAIGLEPPRIS